MNKFLVNWVVGVISFSWTVLMLIYGLCTQDSQTTALGAFTSTVGLSCFVWYCTKEQKNVSLLCRLILVSSLGMSTFTTLTWIIWALGFPISVGTVLNDKMTEAEPMIFFSWFIVMAAFWMFKYESKNNI
jgi:hypothetical protein